MKCPKCNNQETRVIESRDVSEGAAVRRRRECLDCQSRYTTYERIGRPHLVVIKKDGTRQSFNREKLTTGLIRACEKTPVTSVEIDDLVSTIEKKLFETGEAEVSSSLIGRLVMEELAKLNDVAYVRFASVYRNFTDIESFEKELDQLKEKISMKVHKKS